MSKTFRKEPTHNQKSKTKPSQKDLYKKNKKFFVDNYEKLEEITIKK